MALVTPRHLSVETALAAGRARFGSKALVNAYVAGWNARRSGLSADTCPYRRRRGWRVWRSAWLAGWDSGGR